MSKIFLSLSLQSSIKTVVVAQLVRASDCDSEGRGFEPPRLPVKPSDNSGGFFMRYCGTEIDSLLRILLT